MGNRTDRRKHSPPASTATAWGSHQLAQQHWDFEDLVERYDPSDEEFELVLDAAHRIRRNAQSEEQVTGPDDSAHTWLLRQLLPDSPSPRNARTMNVEDIPKSLRERHTQLLRLADKFCRENLLAYDRPHRNKPEPTEDV